MSFFELLELLRLLLFLAAIFAWLLLPLMPADQELTQSPSLQLQLLSVP
jgi:hypothetical protein